MVLLSSWTGSAAAGLDLFSSTGVILPRHGSQIYPASHWWTVYGHHIPSEKQWSCVCVVEFARCGYKWKIMRRMQISRWEPEPCDGYDGNMWFLANMKNLSQDGSDNSSTNTNSKLLYNTFTCVYSSPLMSVFVVELHLFSAVCALVSVAVMC